ncbi:MAG: hypothetical protein H6982_07855 [Chromatiales bacterium]|nr:hypothetical protein [Chromatiales bacterium]
MLLSSRRLGSALAIFLLPLALSSTDAAAKELWVSPTPQPNLPAATLGTWPVTRFGVAVFSFALPDDLAALDAVRVVLLPTASGVGTYTVLAEVKRDGETVSAADIRARQAVPIVLNAGTVTEVDVTAVLAGDLDADSAGNDLVSLVFTTPDGLLLTGQVLGLRVVYSNAPMGTTSIADDAVTAAKIATGAVGADALAVGAVGAAALAPGAVSGFVHVIDGSLSGADVADGSLSGADLADRSVATADLADGAVTGAKIAAGAVGATQLAVGVVGGVAIASSSVSGDPHVVDGSITGADLADGTVTSADVADGSLTGADVADGSLLGTDLAQGTVTGTQIRSRTIDFVHIAAGAVGQFELANGAVNGFKVADGSLTGADVADGSLRSGDLGLLAAVPAECAGDCLALTLGAVCDVAGASYRPVAVACAGGVVSGGATILARTTALGALCTDIAGADAVVTCMQP